MIDGPPRRSWARLGLCFGLLAACDPSAHRRKGVDPVPLHVETTAPSTPTPSPIALLDASGSAYAATLAGDASGTYLFAGDAAYHLAPGRPAERWSIDLGTGPAKWRGRFLYWSDGALKSVPQRGGEPTVLAPVARQPQHLLASGDRCAWFDRAEDGSFTVQTLRDSKPHVVLAPQGTVVAAAMAEARVYFAEREPGPAWRLGVVSLDAGQASYSSPQKGSRAPSQIVLTDDGVFYYDGPSLTVRRLDPDLRHEEVVARGTICSPLAVAKRIYCAQPGGIVALSLDGAIQHVVPLERPGTLVALTASATHVTWLMDVGPDRLTVQSVALAP